ncbi:MAG: hypothetical protein ACI82F_001141 [Planctomycetota bacterium]|jgi:hypothetical protein
MATAISNHTEGEGGLSIPIDEVVAPRQATPGPLWSDESAGMSLVAGPRFAQRRLRRCQRGNVSLLILFMGLVFYALAAMTWNTGELTASKIEAQTAADSAAYSSVVWTGRAVNMVTATNMHVMRDASALGTAGAVLFEGAWVLVNDLIFLFGTVIPQLTNPFTLATGLISLAIFTAEFVLWAKFVAETGWPVNPILDGIDLVSHMSELLDYQQAWVAAVPGLVADQKTQIQDYYDCDLNLHMGNGSTSIQAPLHRGNQLTCLIPMTIRFAYDALASDSWYDDPGIKAMIIGKGRTGWLIGAALGYVGGLAAFGQTHHVLSSQPLYSPLEFGPYGTGLSSSSTWADYSVVASAQKRTTNAASAQYPRFPLRFLAPGLFDDPDPMRPVAYSQAETFNGIDGLLSTVNIGGFNALQSVVSLYPWRVWTDWGWQWQPRLTHGTLIEPSTFSSMGVSPIAFTDNFRETVSTH